jgi:uncharacterized protein (DUF488 family)
MEGLISTIGHSTRGIGEFIEILNSFQIQSLVDVRSFPGSKRFPHFNKESLRIFLEKHSIEYIHMPELGGRRKPASNSKNSVWKNEAFRGYADYMETTEFKNAVTRLEKVAKSKNVAYMCSEAVWWRCHRSLISDYLKLKGWEVIHIMDLNKSQPHSYTSPSRVIQGTLNYSKSEENDDK